MVLIGQLLLPDLGHDAVAAAALAWTQSVVVDDEAVQLFMVVILVEQGQIQHLKLED